jgi:hypothetical protein
MKVVPGSSVFVPLTYIIIIIISKRSYTFLFSCLNPSGTDHSDVSG